MSFSLVDFLQALAAGILVGSAYALMCVGLGIIFGAMRVINFAQGDFLMVGMYAAFYLATAGGLSAFLGPSGGPIVAAFLAGESHNCPGCNLVGANLKRRDLTGANLSGANLRGDFITMNAATGIALNGTGSVGAPLTAGGAFAVVDLTTAAGGAPNRTIPSITSVTPISFLPHAHRTGMTVPTVIALGSAEISSSFVRSPSERYFSVSASSLSATASTSCVRASPTNYLGRGSRSTSAGTGSSSRTTSVMANRRSRRMGFE